MRPPRATPGAALVLLAVATAALVGAWAAGVFGSGRSARVPIAGSSGRASARSAAEWSTRPVPAPRGQPALVTVARRPLAAVVPADFSGLSFEAAALPYLADYGSAGELAPLLRTLGPGIIRIGGLSADKLDAWVPNGGRLPAWARSAVTERELAGVAALARASGWRVLLTVNAAHGDVAAAAEEAAAAHRLMGRSLAGIAIGNEPDRYVREGLRGPGWGFTAYAALARVYKEAIARAAPGVAIAAPDASSGSAVLPWVRAAAALHPALLTDHYYPLTSCGGSHPTAAELLDASVRAGETALLGRLASIARAARTPVRIDETNDISCHGEPGASDTFASALWALDWSMRAMRAGIAGLDFHDLLDEPAAYSPLVFAPGRRGVSPEALARGPAGSAPPALHANPEWYGLLVAASLAGSQPLATSTSNSQLVAAAFLAPADAKAAAGARRASGADGAPSGAQALRIVLIDCEAPGSRPLAVRLSLPDGFVAGSVLRLEAPSIDARAGVALGGAAVSEGGAWGPRLPLPALSAVGGQATVAMPAASAALLTLPAATRAR